MFEFLAHGLSYRHMVMVFVPSQRLRELSQRGAGGFEYKRLYKIESADQSSWQPLDPIRSFEHYKAMYGFGQDNPQWLRISEGNEDYRLRNSRYRQFLEDQKIFNNKIEDLNTESECFGYAKYVHKADGNSTEWRQVIIDRPQGPADGRRKWTTWFMCSPGQPPVSSPGTGPSQETKVDVEWDSLLPAPQHPKIIGTASLEHLEFLAKASKIKEEENLTEAQIAEKLNAMMNEKYSKLKHNEIDQNLNLGPPPITTQDVQNALKRDEEASAIAASPISPSSQSRQLRVSILPQQH